MSPESYHLYLKAMDVTDQLDTFLKSKSVICGSCEGFIMNNKDLYKINETIEEHICENDFDEINELEKICSDINTGIVELVELNEKKWLMHEEGELEDLVYLNNKLVTDHEGTPYRYSHKESFFNFDESCACFKKFYKR